MVSKLRIAGMLDRIGAPVHTGKEILHSISLALPAASARYQHN
jgi:hypothetical protein